MAKYIKAGYDKALEFDPASGVIKYGQYEFFADQVGNKASTSKYTFDDYRRSLDKSAMLYNSPLPQLDSTTESKLRSDFIAAAQQKATVSAGGTRTEMRDVHNGALGAVQITELPSVTKANQIDDNTFEIVRYDVPTDIDFVNRLNAQAKNLNANAAQGQTTDSSRPTPGNARLGKPNYSRAATVLAGEQSPLGGATTTLGS